MAATGDGPLYSGLNATDQSSLQQNAGRIDASFPFAINGSNPDRLLIGLTGIYESTDRGDVVTDVTPKDPSGNSLMSGNVSALAYGIDNPEAAYVATDKGELWIRSSTSGPNAGFKQFTLPGYFEGYIRDMVVDPFDWKTAYFLGTQGEVLATNTAGASWFDLTWNLPSVAQMLSGEADLRAITLYDPNPTQAGQGVLLVAGFGGVYRLINPSSTTPTWSRYGDPVLNKDFPTVLFTSLTYNATDDILVASTYGRGAFQVIQASQTLAVPETVHVSGHLVRLAVDASDSSMLDVFLNGDTQPDFQVPQAQAQAIQITGSEASNSFTIDNSNGRIAVPEIDIVGGSNTDTLTVDSSKDTGSEYASIQFSQITGMGPGTIRYTGIANVNIIGGPQQNTFEVQDPGYGVAATINTGDGDQDAVSVDGSYYGPVTVNLGAGRDFVDICPANQDLSAISAPVTIHGANSASAIVTVHDQNFLSTANWIMTASGIAGNADHADINYDGVDSVVIEAASAGNIFDVQDTPAVSTTTIDTGDGANTVSVERISSPLELDFGAGADTANITPTGQNLDAIHALLTVNGGGSTNLSVDDQQNPYASTWTITNGEVSRSHSFSSTTSGTTVTTTIDYSNLSSLTTNGGFGGNTIAVKSTAAGTSTTVNSGNGVDNVYVERTTGPLTVDTQQSSTTQAFGGFESVSIGTLNGNANTLDGIQGVVTVNTVDRPNLDFGDLLVYDSAATKPEQYTFTRDTIVRSGAAPIYYHVTNQLFAYLGKGGNMVNVQSMAAGLTTDILGGVGNDTFNVGDSANTLNGIVYQFLISIQNRGSRVIVHDEGNRANMNYSLATATLHPAQGYNLPAYRVLRSDWNQQGLGAVIWLTGPVLQSMPVPLQYLDLRTGSGNNTIDVQDLPTGETTVRLNGGGGTNTVQGPDVPNTWQIAGANAGNLDKVVHFASIQSLTGGANSDVFAVKSGGSLAGKIDGGSGVNTLDYSAFAGNVLVDLPLAIATGMAKGLANIQNVTGSRGNDLLVGDADINTLIGGTERNVIIGGGGADRIFGGAGDNLLIGDSTAYDLDLAGLRAILQVWDNPDLSFDQRIKALKKGTTANGRFVVLNRSTVRDDHSSAKLVGGNGQNWFIADTTDKINDGKGPGPNDRLTRI
jgi:hypothetical protein